MPRTTSNRKLLFGLGGVGVVACLGLVVALLVGGILILNTRQASTPQPAVAYVLDTSPRMELAAEGSESQTRLEIAEAVLAEAIRPAESSLTSGLRVFGNGANTDGCQDTDLVVPFAQSNQTQIADELSLLAIGSSSDAALGEAMLAAIRDLSTFAGPHWLVVVTGGIDTCNAQASQLVAQEAQRAENDLQTFVIGYQLTESDSQVIKSYVEEIPNGDYLGAPDDDTLRAIIGAIQNYINNPSDILRAAIAAAATPPPTALPTQPPPTLTTAPSPTPEGYQAQTACDHPYNPLRLGATFTRVIGGDEQTQIVSDVSGDLTRATATVTYENASGASGAFYYECDSAGQSYTKIESVREGVTTTTEFLSVDDALFGPPETFVPGGSHESTSTVRVTQGSRPPFEFTAVDRYTISGPETITVSAGTFEALKIETVSKAVLANGQSSEFTTTTWYVLGIGSVRYIAGDGTISELASYRIP